MRRLAESAAATPESATREARAAGGPATPVSAPAHGPYQLLALQRSVGNAAVARMIGDAAAVPAPAVADAAGSAPPSTIHEDAGRGADTVRTEVSAQASQIADAASAAYSRIDVIAAEQTDSLNQAFAGQQGAALAARGQANATTAAEVSAQQGALTATASGARRLIGDQARAAVDGTNQQVTSLGNEARSTASREAARARASGDQRLAEIRPPPLAADRDIGAGQRRMHHEMSSKAQRELGVSSREASEQLRARDEQRQRQVYEPAKAKAATQVRSGADQADRAVIGALTTSQQFLRRTAAHTQTSTADAHRTVTQALATRRAEAVEQVGQWSSAAKARVAASARDLQAQLVRDGEAAAASVGPAGQEAVEGAVAAVRDAGQAITGSIGETTDTMTTGSADLTQGLRAAAENAGGQIAGGFTAVSAAATQAARHGSTAFAQVVTTGAAAAAAELQQAPSRAAQTLAEEHARGNAELAAAAGQTEATQSTWASDAGQRTAQGAEQYESSARDLGDQANQTPVQGLFGELVASMRSWLRDKLGDVWGGIVSGIILSIPAIIIGVGLLFAGPVGWGILIGLAVVGAGLGIYNRFSEYSADHGGNGPSFWEGAALVGLGIADLTGIPYIVEAAVGQRAFAPQPMSDFERWERGTQGVINLALLVAGGAKKLFGRTGEGNVPVPERGPSGRVRVEPVPGERGPSETVPAETGEQPPRVAVSRARMTELIRQIESGETFEFTPEHAEAIRMNAELATAKWVPAEDGRIRWASIQNQLQLTRWRFLPRLPEVAAILRNALMRLPDGPERVTMLGLLDRWVGGGGSGSGTPSSAGGTGSGGGTEPGSSGDSGGNVPVPVPVPRDDESAPGGS